MKLALAIEGGDYQHWVCNLWCRSSGGVGGGDWGGGTQCVDLVAPS